MKLTNRCPDDDVLKSTGVEELEAQAEAKSTAAVRAERFARRQCHGHLPINAWDRLSNHPTSCVARRHPMLSTQLVP